MKKFIYQDPRRPRVHSRPIDEDDTKARQILEGGGWRIVETIDDAVSPETVEAPEAPATPEASAPAEPKKGKGGKGKTAPEAPATPEA
jgi:hypothetical protein